MTAKPPKTVYRDELLAPPPGEWCVELVLGEADVEKLMTGRVSTDLMETAFRALSWARGDQAWEHYDCPCPRCVAQRTR
jgi:hypothetical protein